MVYSQVLQESIVVNSGLSRFGAFAEFAENTGIYDRSA
jgi:hypothetical protein